MAEYDWTGHLVDGGTRPDAITGLDDAFEASLASMFAAAPPSIQDQLQIMSGYRSPERQAELWEAAVKKYGSPEAARKWVAPPGNSQHNHGNAVDLRFLDPAAQEWVHQNAAAYGLTFPMSHEPWHIEPIGARGAGPAGMPVNALAAPPVPQQQAPAQNQLAQFAYNAPMLNPLAFARDTTRRPIIPL